MSPRATPNRRTPICDDDALRLGRGKSARGVPLDSAAWVTWLCDPAHTTFAYRGRLGSFTARREERGARAYWYAYSKRDGALHKVYLGKAEQLNRARLAAAAATLRRAEAPAIEPPASVHIKTNLPASLTSFVGRERELAEVRRLLAATRLLTLTGAGGVGKTRLALEAAADACEHYPDGVWLVELAALADPRLVPQAIAGALGVVEQPGRSLTETLVRWLAGKRLVLLLDNCEHLLDACAQLAEALLRACHELRILATSREALRAAGETTWRVPSLALPDPDGPLLAAALAEVEAVRLFDERARAARPDFAVTDRNAPAAARICRRLDGIPLAIELAAARASALSVEQIAARLDDQLRLLTRGARTAVPRQQTLRATIDWSHDLLSEDERAVFRRLAVFAGSFALEAAEAVCEGESGRAGDGEDGGGGVTSPLHPRSPAPPLPLDVLDLLSRLVDQSLVQVESDVAGEARYRLLETVRQYAGEKLAEAGEAAAMQRRHAEWCLALARRAEADWGLRDQLTWLARLDADGDNLRAAMTWSLDHDAALGLALAPCLRYYWQARAYLTEGRGWLERMLRAEDSGGPERAARRARALVAAIVVTRVYGDHAACRAWGTEALALSRTLGDTPLLVKALIELGAVGVLDGDFHPARAWLEEALPLARELDDRRSVAIATFFLGRLTAAQGDYDRARALFAESLALHRAGGDIYFVSFRLRELGLTALHQGEAAPARALMEEALASARQVGAPITIALAQEGLGLIACWQGDLREATRRFEASLDEAQSRDLGLRVAFGLIRLGQVAWRQGELERARALLEEGLASLRLKGYRQGIGTALHGLGATAWRQGDAAGATERLRESLALRHEMGERLGIAECLETLAAVVIGAGQPKPSARRAARQLGAAEALRETIGAPVPPVARPDHEATMQAARATMGEGAFAAAWAAGKALSIEQAVAEALDAAGPATAADSGAPTAARPGPNGLSRREVEVLRLVAAGRSNREVAAELSVSVRTVERHIENLYGKIGARNRADATAFAFRHGLS
jgi:predicted ATPase/DNA-binding NarL/FixJ family response regulator